MQVRRVRMDVEPLRAHERIAHAETTNGIEFGRPSLSMHAWHAARYGVEARAGPYRVPRQAWVAHRLGGVSTVVLRTAGHRCFCRGYRAGTASGSGQCPTARLGAAAFPEAGGWYPERAACL